MIPKWIAFTTAAAITAAVFLYINNQANQINTLKLEISNNKTISAQAESKAQAEVRSTEAGLVSAAGKVNQETNEQIHSLTVQRDSLVKRLRIAQANAATAKLVYQSTSPSTTGSTPQGNPGAELPGTIGEEDVAEAHRADTIRLHLKACYAKYAGAEAAMKELN